MANRIESRMQTWTDVFKIVNARIKKTSIPEYKPKPQILLSGTVAANTINIQPATPREFSPANNAATTQPTNANLENRIGVWQQIFDSVKHEIEKSPIQTAQPTQPGIIPAGQQQLNVTSSTYNPALQTIDVTSLKTISDLQNRIKDLQAENLRLSSQCPTPTFLNDPLANINQQISDTIKNQIGTQIGKNQTLQNAINSIVRGQSLPQRSNARELITALILNKTANAKIETDYKDKLQQIRLELENAKSQLTITSAPNTSASKPSFVSVLPPQPPPIKPDEFDFIKSFNSILSKLGEQRIAGHVITSNEIHDLMSEIDILKTKLPKRYQDDMNTKIDEYTNKLNSKKKSINVSEITDVIKHVEGIKTEISSIITTSSSSAPDDRDTMIDTLKQRLLQMCKQQIIDKSNADLRTKNYVSPVYASPPKLTFSSPKASILQEFLDKNKGILSIKGGAPKKQISMKGGAPKTVSVDFDDTTEIMVIFDRTNKMARQNPDCNGKIPCMTYATEDMIAQLNAIQSRIDTMGQGTGTGIGIGTGTGTGKPNRALMSALVLAKTAKQISSNISSNIYTKINNTIAATLSTGVPNVVNNNPGLTRSSSSSFTNNSSSYGSSPPGGNNSNNEYVDPVMSFSKIE